MNQNLASIRQEIARFEHPATIERRAKLLDRIKLEARWLLLTTRAVEADHDHDRDHFAIEERRAFLKVWPDIRHRRVPAAYMVSFYDLMADQASTFVHLIEIRRRREAARKARQ